MIWIKSVHIVIWYHFFRDLDMNYSFLFQWYEIWFSLLIFGKTSYHISELFSKSRNWSYLFFLCRIGFIIYLAFCTTHCDGRKRWTTCQLCSSALHHSSVGWLAAKFCAFRASTLASRVSDEIFLIGSNRHTAKAEIVSSLSPNWFNRQSAGKSS